MKGAKLILVIFVVKFSEGNLKSRKCLFVREVQFMAYSFFTDCKGNDFLFRGIMYEFVNFIWQFLLWIFLFLNLFFWFVIIQL